MDIGEESSQEDEAQEESEYEECSDSEEEEENPRLKPVFVRKLVILLQLDARLSLLIIIIIIVNL